MTDVRVIWIEARVVNLVKINDRQFWIGQFHSGKMTLRVLTRVVDQQVA